ncbi:sigma-54-dependent Fis family transcriptional regulator, partial [Candidatus Sumerlaeota bacterium]|nr:sigma-54-dependent Fis family transcriptional regulator [Candidatus Sumerlaeota bacterium]
FLDETGNIPKETQGKLLRVLESHSVKRVGDVVERPIDIRLITATNSDLAEMVRRNEFREDLYYRLNVVPIHLPPLRERHGDIPLLAMCLLEAFRRKNPVRAAGFTPEAMALMESYHWPGNVRELKNMVQRMAILCDGERIEVQHLPEEIRQAPLHTPKSNLPHTWEEMKQLKQKVRETAVERLERQFLLESLRRNDSNISRAAEDVGMQRTHFHALIKKYDLK